MHIYYITVQFTICTGADLFKGIAHNAAVPIDQYIGLFLYWPNVLVYWPNTTKTTA